MWTFGTTSVADARAPRIGIALADPYLTFLVQRQLPEAIVVDVSDAQRSWSSDLDLILTHAGDPRLAAAPAGRSPRIAVVLDRSDGGVTVPGAVAYLRRPIDAVSLSAMLVAALGQPDREDASSRVHARWVGMLAVVRLAAAAIAGVVSVGGGWHDALASAVIAYAAVRVAVPARERLLVWADAIVAVAALGLTGGTTGPYGMFSLTAAFGLGSLAGPRGLVVGAGGLGALGATAAAAAGNVQVPLAVVGLALIHVAAGVIGSFVGRSYAAEVEQHELARTRDLLLDLHHDVAQDPGRFDAQRVAERAVKDVCEIVGPERVVVALMDGELSVAASAGVRGLAAGTLLDQDTGVLRACVRDGIGYVKAAELSWLPDASEDEEWAVVPLDHARDRVGLLFAAVGRPHGRTPQLLREVGADTASAIHSARLFRRLLRLAVDDERRRVAAELHDGLAQTLTHVRLELALAERQGAPLASGLERLLAEANAELRESIARLAGGPRGGDLISALQRYVADVDGTRGVEVALSTAPLPRLDPGPANEVFSQVRQGVVRALGEEDVRRIEIEVACTGRDLTVTVAHDGDLPTQAPVALRYRTPLLRAGAAT